VCFLITGPMPIKVKENLPAVEALRRENVFVMTEERALHQDIRPLRIAILNLMPEKPKTELQLLRRLSNTPIQTEIDLLHTETHMPKNTPRSHLDQFYTTFSSIRHRKYDGMIITGAPVEHLEFKDVEYWDELKEIMEWTKRNVNSTLHICWAAQAGLYHHHGIGKYPLDKKRFGVFRHTASRNYPLTRGFDDVFWVPHSRHTTVSGDEIRKNRNLRIISESEESGVYIVASRNDRQFFVTGHSEYDPMTLAQEFQRDRSKGLEIEIPRNYFPDNDASKLPLVKWNSHSTLLFMNWVNYYVYQMTPYDISKIS
jgi:homoserine O-succinyltransferase/O-acetyltransferase